MPLNIERVDTWAALLEDKPGSLAGKLSALANAGIVPELVLARRQPEIAGSGVVFVTPIKGSAQCRAARKAGFDKTENLHTVRVEGAEKVGQCGRITEALAAKGLNLRGVSVASIGNRFVAHIAMDTTAEATKAMRILRGL